MATSEEDQMKKSFSDSWTLIYSEKENIDEIGKEICEDKDTQINTDVEEIYSTKEVYCDSTESCDDEFKEIKKEEDSDGVSVISEESEAEDQLLENDRIEEIDDWKVETNNFDSKMLISTKKMLVDQSLAPNTAIVFSIIAMLIGMIIGQLMSFNNFQLKEAFPYSFDMQKKVIQLSEIEGKLKDINEVKKALDEIQLRMFDEKNLHELHLKKILQNQQKPNNKNEKLSENKSNSQKHDYFININFNNNIKQIQTMHANFCLTIKNTNIINNFKINNTCEPPRILSDLINYKKNLNEIMEFEQYYLWPGNYKKMSKVDKTLDALTESLLFEYVQTLFQFSLKIQNIFYKTELKLQKKLCQFNNDWKNDNDGSLLLNKLNKSYLNNCNNTYKSNVKKLNGSDSAFKKFAEFENLNKIISEENSNNPNNKSMKNFNKYNIKSYAINENFEKDFKSFLTFKNKGEKLDNKNWKKHKDVKNRYDPDNKKENLENSKNSTNSNNKVNKNMKMKNKNLSNQPEAEKKDWNSNFRYTESLNDELKKYRRRNKEYKYIDIKDKYNQANGEWQYQRGKAREKLRNTNWYFTRADSREAARVNKEPNNFDDDLFLF